MNKNLSSPTKALLLALVLVLAFTALAACSGASKPKTPADVNEVYQKLLESGHLPALTAVPERDLFEVYGIDSSKVKQWVFAMSDNYSIDAGEVAIFEANDEEYASELASKLTNHLDRIKNVSKDYSPQQSAKLEPVEVKTVGSFVYLVVGENYDALMKIMKDNIG